MLLLLFEFILNNVEITIHDYNEHVGLDHNYMCMTILRLSILQEVARNSEKQQRSEDVDGLNATMNEKIKSGK